eukprot:jgi/Picre1/31962/NNA_007310.t1
MVAPQADGVTEEQEQGTGPQQANLGDSEQDEAKGNEINGGTKREGEDAHGIEGQTTVDNTSDAHDRRDDKQTKLDTNPFRSISAAAESWEKKTSSMKNSMTSTRNLHHSKEIQSQAIRSTGL